MCYQPHISGFYFSRLALNQTQDLNITVQSAM